MPSSLNGKIVVLTESSGKDANLQEADAEQEAAQQADVSQTDDFISRLEQAETRDARRTADKT